MYNESIKSQGRLSGSSVSHMTDLLLKNKTPNNFICKLNGYMSMNNNCGKYAAISTGVFMLQNHNTSQPYSHSDKTMRASSSELALCHFKGWFQYRLRLMT